MADLTHLTVAVWVPGTQVRVLVDQLDGTDAEAIDSARSMVSKVANSMQYTRAAVVRREDITTVVSTTEATDGTTQDQAR